ncbi:VOC family protein [Paenibacillus humicola]|uniref:VOC family protein n=1 Tax=Paenibacillus humicola TaxID=3110540 RepID=UPI00237B8A9D|nr:VOC family protein [Paenibacillus humicola]
MGILKKEAICQIALVVKDIEQAARHYAELFGVDVPRIFQIPPHEEANTQYRGRPTSTRAKLAVIDLGPLVLELTEPDDEPSSWKEFLETNGEGVHHIGFMTDDREKTIGYFAQKGIPVRHYGEYPGGSYTFVDSGEQLGVILNIKHEPKQGGDPQ